MQYIIYFIFICIIIFIIFLSRKKSVQQAKEFDQLIENYKQSGINKYIQENKEKLEFEIRYDLKRLEEQRDQVSAEIVGKQTALQEISSKVKTYEEQLRNMALTNAKRYEETLMNIAKDKVKAEQEKCRRQLRSLLKRQWRKWMFKQKQRVVIAISTILNPKVLIADEPSSALDVTSQKMVIKMLRDMMEKGYIKAMIFITHELPLLYNVTDDIMVMYAGQIVERGTAKEMVFDPLHPYSRGLMNSILVPEEGTRDNKLIAIPGTPPNLKKPPQGCRFAERCRYASPQCRVSSIPMLDLGDGRAFRCGHSVQHLREVYGSEE